MLCCLQIINYIYFYFFRERLKTVENCIYNIMCLIIIIGVGHFFRFIRFYKILVTIVIQLQ